MTVWIMALEPIETRYTGEWYEELPRLLSRYLPGADIKQLSGDIVSAECTPGAFLNFYGTSVWKSSQLVQLAEAINSGKVKRSDYVLFTDAWNPMILQVRYMSDLMDLDLRIGGIWHAGSYDPEDFLGRASGGKEWAQCTERAMFNACDHNFFATDFHIELFCMTHPGVDRKKIIRSGLPFQYWKYRLPELDRQKTDTIVFPHRIAPEKRLDVFLALKERRPQYEFIVCQDQKLSKQEYHEILARSKIVFSANQQETLGISTCGEGPWFGCVPMAPDRLSYAEIFSGYPEFLYPCDFLDSQAGIDRLAERLDTVIQEFDYLRGLVYFYIDREMQDYFCSDYMFKTIKESLSDIS